MNKIIASVELVNTNWDSAYQPLLKHIRSQVFIDEQQVPEDLEWDEEDKTAHHILATIDGKAVGTGRITRTRQIGRMAVLKEYRKQSVGSCILTELLDIEQDDLLSPIWLNAQLTAIPFYQKFDFIEQGEIFDDAGIAHMKMVRQCT